MVHVSNLEFLICQFGNNSWITPTINTISIVWEKSLCQNLQVRAINRIKIETSFFFFLNNNNNTKLLENNGHLAKIEITLVTLNSEVPSSTSQAIWFYWSTPSNINIATNKCVPQQEYYLKLHLSKVQPFNTTLFLKYNFFKSPFSKNGKTSYTKWALDMLVT